ncbi:hypothetical protein ABPG75_006082 [Micractinium tetrahymenae]
MVQVSGKTIIKGVGLYFAAAVSGYLYLRSSKAPAPTPGCGCGGRHDRSGSAEAGGSSTEEEGADGQATFDRIADFYDSCINTDEVFMGIKLMRRWLMRQAEGDVLEVSAGTGRNLPYYDLPRLRSLTLTDTSRHMLVNAADKLEAMAAKQGPAAAATPVRVELADAQHLVAKPGASSGSSGGRGGDDASSSSRVSSSANDVAGSAASSSSSSSSTPAAEPQTAGAPHRPPLREPRTFPPHSFDVVVDTFGLCSQQDPVTALKEMARVCKPGGRILLLQHGKGTWGFINNVLDNGAGEHFRKWGCWWNRDIERIVKQAGLEVESLSRWHFGTTYLCVARPPAAARSDAVGAA